MTITGHVTLGDNVHIGVGACIFGTERVEIGDDCSISPGAKLFTGSFDAETMHLANPQLENKKYASGPIVVGARSIVGANSVVLPNVSIGSDVLVGALSLVNRSIDGPGVYAGCPAKKTR